MLEPVFTEDVALVVTEDLVACTVDVGDPPCGVEGHEQHVRDVQVVAELHCDSGW